MIGGGKRDFQRSASMRIGCLKARKLGRRRILAKRLCNSPGTGIWRLRYCSYLLRAKKNHTQQKGFIQGRKDMHMRVMSAFSKVIGTRCCNINTGEEVVCMEISHYQ